MSRLDFAHGQMCGDPISCGPPKHLLVTIEFARGPRMEGTVTYQIHAKVLIGWVALLFCIIYSNKQHV